MSAKPTFSNEFVSSPADRRVVSACKILIGGPGRPSDPAKAIQMFLAAMGEGSGAATERLAVLAAMGVARPPDWVEAINLLVRSAEQGYRPAQGQLAVLAGEGFVPAEGAGADLWKTLARKIDLKGLLKAPPLTQARAEPAIALLSGLATPAMCDWLIAKGGRKVVPGRVGDSKTGEWVLDPMRTGEAAGFGLDDTDLILALTQKRLELASGLHVHQQEAPHVLSYQVGQEYKAQLRFPRARRAGFPAPAGNDGAARGDVPDLVE